MSAHENDAIHPSYQNHAGSIQDMVDPYEAALLARNDAMLATLTAAFDEIYRTTPGTDTKRMALKAMELLKGYR